MRERVRLHTLWIGPSLGRFERACLRSALRQGHQVTLHCYDVPAGVPDGVDLADAGSLVPRTRIIRHRAGSPALFSNLFRYLLQQRGLGTWIDADLYLVAPIDGERPTLFGRQGPQRLNNAVLRLPQDSPLLPPLIGLFDETEVPFWLDEAEQAAAAQRLRETGRTGLAQMPWGSAGPTALTAVARRFGLEDVALPPEVFYPAPWRIAQWILNPVVKLEHIVRPGTVAVHLWNELIREFKEKPARPGSFLARLHEEGE